jgi:hypothetical protein
MISYRTQHQNLQAAFGGSSAFGQNQQQQQQQPAANPMFGNLSGTPNTTTGTTGFGVFFFVDLGHVLIISKAHSVILPTRLRAPLLLAPPNQQRALARSEVEALLEEALLDKAAHPPVGQEQIQGSLDNPQPRTQLVLSAPDCLAPTSPQLLGLALQRVHLFLDDSLRLNLHYYFQGPKALLLL